MAKQKELSNCKFRRLVVRAVVLNGIVWFLCLLQFPLMHLLIDPAIREISLTGAIFFYALIALGFLFVFLFDTLCESFSGGKQSPIPAEEEPKIHQ